MNRDSKKIYNNYRFIIEQKSPQSKIVPNQINLDEEDFENFDWGSPKGEAIGLIRLPEEKLSSVHDKVIRAMFFIKDGFPTTADMLNQMRKVATYDVPTAAVDANYNLYYNPTVFYCLPLHFITSILAHEAMHYLNNTLKRKNWAENKLKLQVDHDTLNIATDLTMNYELVRQEFKFPKGFFVPNKDGKYTFPEWMGGKSIDIQANTSEQVYDFIMKNKPPKEPGDSGGSGGDPSPQYIPKVGDIVGDKETNTKRKIVKIDKKNKKVITVPV